MRDLRTLHKCAIRGVKVSGLSSVETNTALVTKAGEISNSSARIVVTTATGIDARITPAWRAGPDKPSKAASPNATNGAAIRDRTTATATSEGRSGTLARSS